MNHKDNYQALISLKKPVSFRHHSESPPRVEIKGSTHNNFIIFYLW